MNPELLERVLACRDLPTLPAVAMRVIELTSSDNVSMKALADTIQNDQALAAKILRTVNSSMYGLCAKCSSINQAIVMLGLSAVKTLALGFTLVTAIRDSNTGEFDLEDHWRRALHTGIAARAIAGFARLPTPEECFLGGLLQDVGMIALYQTLGDKYLQVIDKADGDHRRLGKFELEAFELQHADIGALLATRWKLPESLVIPIKYHERPTAAPIEHTGVVRAVGLGNIASDVLTATEPAENLRKFYQRAEQWFAMNNSVADDVLAKITSQTREVATLLNVPTGLLANPAALLESARQQLLSIAVPASEHVGQAAPGVDNQSVDQLTGLCSRMTFDRTLVAALEQARMGICPASIALLELDGLDEVNTQYGREAGDALLIAIAGRLQGCFEPLHGLLARFDGGRFAAVLTRVDRGAALKALEAARASVSATPIVMIAGKMGSPASLPATVSVGLCHLDSEMAKRFEDTSGVIAILDQALKAAKRAGQNTVRVYAPALAA